jgi:hypothetical protein
VVIQLSAKRVSLGEKFEWVSEGNGSWATIHFHKD